MKNEAHDDLTAKLIIVDEKSYGQDYKKHLLEQYKLCVEMADKNSARRTNANRFFLSANTLLLTAIGVLTKLESGFAALNPLWVIITSFAGILFCWVWLVTIRCYRDLSEAKFKVINTIEKKLPAAAFNVEWLCLNPENKTTRYPQLTKVESYVPKIFAFLYFILILIVLAPPVYSWFMTFAS